MQLVRTRPTVHRHPRTNRSGTRAPRRRAHLTRRDGLLRGSRTSSTGVPHREEPSAWWRYRSSATWLCRACGSPRPPSPRGGCPFRTSHPAVPQHPAVARRRRKRCTTRVWPRCRGRTWDCSVSESRSWPPSCTSTTQEPVRQPWTGRRDSDGDSQRTRDQQRVNSNAGPKVVLRLPTRAPPPRSDCLRLSQRVPVRRARCG